MWEGRKGRSGGKEEGRQGEGKARGWITMPPMQNLGYVIVDTICELLGLTITHLKAQKIKHYAGWANKTAPLCEVFLHLSVLFIVKIHISHIWNICIVKFLENQRCNFHIFSHSFLHSFRGCLA